MLPSACLILRGICKLRLNLCIYFCSHKVFNLWNLHRCLCRQGIAERIASLDTEVARSDDIGTELGALGTVVAAAYTINRLLRLAPVQARPGISADSAALCRYQAVNCCWLAYLECLPLISPR